MSVGLTRIKLEKDGAVFQGTAAVKDGTFWFHLNGETYSMVGSTRQRRGSKAGGTLGDPGQSLSPMPGKVIKLLIKVGDKVNAGDVLLIMEAMKMEYTLKALADGKVADVNCAPGDQVALGALLVKIETK
jgi:biotin carboxyl carrier protein